MGWENGSDIFDAVCKEVIDGVREQGLEETIAANILTTLILELQNLGWDNEFEALERNGSWNFVHVAFARQGVMLDGEEVEDEA